MKRNTSIFPETAAARVRAAGIVAVLTVDAPDRAVQVARALLDGGVPAMELTLRTDGAIDCLRAIRAEVPEMLAGVGTVIEPAQLDAIVEAGAAFAVAPGCNETVLERALEKGLPFAPGIMTPSDIERALGFGCRLLKFFPAGPLGGLAYLKSMAVPYLHLGLQFIPLGGVNEENMTEYLGESCIAAVGGSWLAPAKLIEAEDYAAIRARAASATKRLQAHRLRAAGS